jgi:hypothetical protein
MPLRRRAASARSPRWLTGSIKHRGGIFFINLTNGDTFKVKKFIISLTHKTLSAIVSGTGVRVTLLALRFSHARVRVGASHVKVTRIGGRLTTASATALNTALGTTIFTPGMKVATLTTLVRF